MKDVRDRVVDFGLALLTEAKWNKDDKNFLEAVHNVHFQLGALLQDLDEGGEHD